MIFPFMKVTPQTSKTSSHSAMRHTPASSVYWMISEVQFPDVPRLESYVDRTVSVWKEFIATENIHATWLTLTLCYLHCLFSAHVCIILLQWACYFYRPYHSQVDSKYSLHSHLQYHFCCVFTHLLTWKRPFSFIWTQ